MDRKRFATIFEKYKHCPIALFGLGPVTEAVLREIREPFDIVGLLDSYQHAGIVFDMPVISLEDAFKRNIAAIIILARQSSARVIANRIRDDCKRHGVKLFDAEGKDLTVPVRERNALKNLLISKEHLIREIDAHDVISFDIFDTLLTREILYPSDIFTVVEKKMPDFLQEKIPFAIARQRTEREIARVRIPQFDEIYEQLAKSYGLREKEKDFIKNLELDTEAKFLIPRKAMCDVFHYALEKGKFVILVSDMYLTSEILSDWLGKHGITGYRKLYVSGEYQTDKRRELFRYVREDFSGVAMLHVGDDQEADIEAARQYDFDTAKIASGLEIFEASGAEHDWEQSENLADRIRLGLFIARVFNSPFSPLEPSPQDIGFSFFAPPISEFILWLYTRTASNQDKTLLFGARDGFLPCKLFEELQKNYESKIDAKYFLTSRESASLAGIMDEADIKRVWNLPFTGDHKEKLKVRFKIFSNEIDSKNFKEKVPMILSRATKKRTAYLAYIRKLRLPEGQKAFLDFVSVGTCQFYLEKIMGEKLRGYYFIKLDSDEEKNTLLSESWLCGKTAEKFLGNYVLMENILSAPHPSLREFDEKGVPVYGEEHRTKEEIQYLEQIHEGILEYFRRYLRLTAGLSRFENEKIPLFLFQMIHKILPATSFFWEMQWDDGFYGRTAKMKELV